MANSNNSVIAFDYGSKRIGVAVANLETRLPQPAGAIQQTETLFDDIRTLTDANNAITLVVGLPRSLDGNETAQTAEARKFAEELGAHLGLPVHLQDEAVTSRKAEEELRERGVRYNKEDVDALAATYILTDFLQEHPGTII